MSVSIHNKRVFMICGHAQSGKTSLTESLLYKSGSCSRLGRVDEGNSLSDYQEDEIERKSSINASIFSFSRGDFSLTCIDTPGYLDFVGEVISSARAVDFAVLVIDAQSGVEVGTEKAWEIIQKENIPCLFFVNKLDKENTDFSRILKDIQVSLTKKASPLVFPVGREASFEKIEDILDKKNIDSLNGPDKDEALKLHTQIIDSIAETDDALMEKYLEAGELSFEEIKAALKKAVLSLRIYPVLAGSAVNLVGIEEVLSVITEIMPSPLNRKPPALKNESGEDVEVKPQESEKFLAQVFKTVSDPYVGQLSIFRVFRGKISSNSGFYNVSKQSKERIGQIYSLFGKEQKPVDSVSVGDIAAIAKLKDTSTQDTLSADSSSDASFPKMIFPVPAYSSSVKPKTRQDEEKISQALHKLTAEDPTFQVSRDSQTKELVVSGVGELHINIIISRIKKRFGVDVEIGTPKVPYLETITKKVKVQGKYKKQTGGHGQYGDVWIEVEPLERGKSFEFVDKIVGGAIPRNFIPSVEKGIRKGMAEGFLAGYPLTDIKVILFDGSYHAVDSSDIAFQIAGAMALKKALEQANVVLLEPIMNVEISVPDEFMGSITGDINSRRGRVLGMDAKGKNQVVKALIPLAEMFKYASDLRSVTGGRGSYTMSFSHYEIVPQRIAQSIIAQAKQAKGDK